MQLRITAALGLALLISHQAMAQPDPNDTSLALWLDASALSLSNGDPVSLWTDSSNHATTFEPRTTLLDESTPAERNPKYIASNPAFNGMPTVSFERDAMGNGDPNTPFSGGFDGLVQTSNLGAGDPLDIGDGSDLTIFVVNLEDSITNSGEPTLGAVGTVLARRGTGGSQYTIQTEPGTNRYLTVNYGPGTVFPTVEAATMDQAQLTTLTIAEAVAADPYQFTENGTVLTNAAGPIASRNGPGSVPEGLALGAHEQDCCGFGEWFSGDIAEVIIYDRLLSPSETAALNSYLGSKYGLTIVPEPSSAALMLVAGLFAVRRRR